MYSPEKCDAGKYRSGAMTSCTICQVGHISDTTGSSSCTKCEAGMTSNADRTACGEKIYKFCLSHLILDVCVVL